MLDKVLFKEKMTNLKVITAKTVKFSIEIFGKMILIGNYTCSRSTNEESHLCLAKYL